MSLAKKPLLVPTGDPAGVGPEISLKAAGGCGWPCVLFGDAARLAGSGLEIVDTGALPEAVVSAAGPTDAGGRAQLAALDAAIDRALAGEGRAIVTAPTSKAAIERSGVAFTGQTEHLARRAGLADDDVTMMFLGPRLRVALATTHLSLRAVPDAITVPRVKRAILHLADALTRLGYARPSIVVGALNPHAGEDGLFGTEDRDVIAAAVEAARRETDARVSGPTGAETAFRRASAGEVDGVVAMFHDQATIASKLLDWGEAVNVTWGLPFVRTSVDHGVAYDAVGRADPAGMEAALRMALALTEGER